MLVTGTFTPEKKLLDRAVIGGPGVRVADRDGKELEELFPGRRPGIRDERGGRERIYWTSENDSNEILTDHYLKSCEGRASGRRRAGTRRCLLRGLLVRYQSRCWPEHQSSSEWNDNLVIYCSPTIVVSPCTFMTGSTSIPLAGHPQTIRPYHRIHGPALNERRKLFSHLRGSWPWSK